jgi:hypothetical protein
LKIKIEDVCIAIDRPVKNEISYVPVALRYPPFEARILVKLILQCVNIKDNSWAMSAQCTSNFNKSGYQRWTSRWQLVVCENKIIEHFMLFIVWSLERISRIPTFITIWLDSCGRFVADGDNLDSNSIDRFADQNKLVDMTLSTGKSLTGFNRLAVPIILHIWLRYRK